MWSTRCPALAFALFASEAIAQNAPASPAGTLRIVLPVVDPGCSKPGPGDDVILVCGRTDGLYRIDPTVLATVRARGALDNPPRPDGKGRLFREACSPVGGRPCPGQGTLPVSSIALVVATALIKVAKGEDVRPMLRPGPSEYELYMQETAADDAKQARPTAKSLPKK